MAATIGKANTYDIITVGGGLGGSTLARAMAEKGARVLVVERETEFKDRVRGEQLASWGAAEARELGIYDLLVSNCAHELPWWDVYLGSARIQHRDLINTTPAHLPNLTFFHPEMQEMLLAEAAAAGAEVRRGARVRGVEPGTAPSVTIEHDARTETIEARLVVGADGRSSPLRKWAGFDVQRDPDRLFIAGVIFEEMPVAEDSAWLVNNLTTGQRALLFPQGEGRVRAYLVCPKEIDHRFQGEKDVSSYIKESVKVGVPEQAFAGVRTIGPLATFSGADSWVEHPYGDRVALIGDAAATSDPSFGQGLSLTVRDVRVLRDKLLGEDDWDIAGHAYADEHDEYYDVIHTVEDWFTELFSGFGPEADARRAQALPLLAQDPTRVPDPFQNGPENVTADDATRRRFFGEE